MSQRLFTFCFAVGLAAVLVGCGGTEPLSDSSPDSPPAHTLIYVIHGDGDYLYHEDGTAKQADQEALAQARLVAAHAPATEVFIFHQRSRQKLFGLFPQSDGTFYHYRNGTLVTEESYRREPGGTGLSREATLYREHRHPEGTDQTLLYYGHDIKERSGRGYHASYPEYSFGLDDLVGGLKAFGASEDPFELIVLSTCNNGSPGTVAALASLTRYVLASPEDLHLSYIDSQPLHRVASTDEGIEELAPRLAERAYDRLAGRTETAVTLALYDTEHLKPQLDVLASTYVEMWTRFFSVEAPPPADFVDCRDGMLPELDANMSGVQQWYHPPSFGRRSKKNNHSGWGCPRIGEQRVSGGGTSEQTQPQR